LNGVEILSNQTGIDTVQKAELTQVFFNKNDRDCRVTEGLIISDLPSDNDGTCVAKPGATGVDCAVPPLDATVVERGDDLAAAIKAGGLVLLQSGQHIISIEQAISQDVEITSCEPDLPAELYHADFCKRTLLLEGPPGVTASVHDLRVVGGTAGLTARGGLHLDLDRVDISGESPFCNDTDRGLEISGGSTGDVTDVNILGAKWGARIDESSDVNFTNVLIDGSEDWGLYLRSPKVASTSRATVTLDNVTITETNDPGATGHGMLAISTNVKVVNSTFACNQNSNVRAVTWPEATDTTVLSINQSSIGRLADGTPCAKEIQSDGVRISRLVELSLDDVEISNHPGFGVALEAGSPPAAITDTNIIDNGTGLLAERAATLTSTQLNNGQDCVAVDGLIVDGGANSDSDESCFEPPVSFTLAPATTNDGYSMATVAGQDVLRIDRPIDALGGEDVYSEFVITASEVAPAGGLDVEWTLGASTFADLATADRADIVFESQVAAKRTSALAAQLDALPGELVSSPRVVTIPEGKKTVTVRVVPRVDLDPVEAISIGIADSAATLDAVIVPTDFEITIVRPAEPLVINRGESARIQIQLTPALPAFARVDEIQVPWTISGPDATALVADTTDLVSFGPEKLGVTSSTKSATIVATEAATTRHDLTFGISTGDELDFVIQVPPLVVETITPRLGDGYRITQDDESLTVLRLEPGNTEQGFVVGLNRVADADTPVTFVLVGTDVGLAQPVEVLGDFTTKTRFATVPAGQSEVFVPLQAASDNRLETVEGFEIIAHVGGPADENGDLPPDTQPVDETTPRLFGFIAPDSFRVDLVEKESLAVAEGDQFTIAATVTPGNPYSVGLSVPWAIVTSFDATESDFDTSPGIVEFVFGEAGDTADSMTRDFTVVVREHDGVEESEKFGLGLASEATPSLRAGTQVSGTIADTSDTAVRVVSVRPSDGHAISLPGDAGPRQVVALDSRRQEQQGIIVQLDRPAERDLEILLQVDDTQIELAVPIDIENDLAFGSVVTTGDVVFGGIASLSAGETELFIPLIASVTDDFEPVEGFRIRARVNGTPDERDVSLDGIIQPSKFEVRIRSLGPLFVQEGESVALAVGIVPGNPYGDVVEVPWKIEQGGQLPAASADDFVEASGVVVLAPADAAELLQVQIATDAVAEPGEFFEVALDVERADDRLVQVEPNPKGGIIGTAPTSYTILVAPADRIVIDGKDAIQMLPTEEVRFVIRVDEPVETETEIAWRINGIEIDGVQPIESNDLLQVSGIATIEAGDDEVEVVLSAPEDSTGTEKAEAFQITIEPPAVDPIVMAGVVQPDNVEVTLVPVDAQGSIARGSEAGGLAFDVVMTPAYAFASNLSFDWSLSGDPTFGAAPVNTADFVDTSGSVSFAVDPSDTLDRATRRVEIAVVNDQQAEPAEGFALVVPHSDLDPARCPIERV